MNVLRKPGILSPVVIIAVCVVLAGCASYGPKSMNRDQLNYGYSIGENWKNQMLANIVKMRFVDMPVFVDVGTIVSGYSIETSVNGRLGFGDSFTGGNSQGLGAQGKFTDRPTITYMPKTGNDYPQIHPRTGITQKPAGFDPGRLQQRIVVHLGC